MDGSVFTPVSATIGGLLIGLSAVVLMVGLGKIAGISGIMRAAAGGGQGGRTWRLVFLVALAGTAWMVFTWGDAGFDLRDGYPRWALLTGGLLVGFGTALGSGCTSGHGVCGLARFSKRSLVATMTFIATAMLTVYVLRHMLGVLP